MLATMPKKLEIAAPTNCSDSSRPTMPEEREMLRSGILARSIPLRNLAWVVKRIHDDFRHGVASYGNEVPSTSTVPMWQGAATWARMCETLQRERNWDTQRSGNSEACFRVLQELAGKDMWDLNSHDLRMMLLLKETCIPAYKIQEVQPLFSEEPHTIALSYQWAAPFGEVFQGLCHVCSLDDCVWIDIVFNSQGASLDSETVMQITRDIYVKCDRHVLLVHKGQKLTGLMGRAWIALEVAVRFSHGDAAIVELIDPHNTAEEYFQDSKKSSAHTQNYDFFSNLEAHFASDVALIKGAVQKVFGTDYYPGNGPRDAFNTALNDFFRLAGGIQCIESLRALRNTEGDQGILDEGWDVSEELEDKGKFRECLRVRECLLESARRVYGPENLQVAAILSNIGNVFESLGDSQQALAKHEEALQIEVKKLGNDRLDVARSLMNIGNAYDSLGQYQEALVKYEQSRQIKVKILGHDHKSVASVLDNIGIVHGNLGNTAKALKYHEMALAIEIKAKGHDHPDVATSLNNIGVVHEEEGNYDLALAKYEESLRILIKKHGHGHLDVATRLNNIGEVFQKSGKLKEALAKHEEAMAIQVKNVGNEHPAVANSLTGIGLVYEERGEYALALAKHEEALRILVKIHKSVGHDHLSITKTWMNIGSVYEAQGKFDLALAKYEESLQVRSKHRGHDQVLYTGVCLAKIGAVYGKMGDNTKALEYLEKALAIEIKAKGQDHPDVATSLNNIGVVHEKEGRYDLALAKYEESLRILIKKHGHGHLDVATHLDTIGEVYRKLGECQQALAKHEESLEIKGKILGPDHLTVASAWSTIGTVYQELGAYEQAAAKHEESARIKATVLAEHLEVAAELDVLCHVYQLAGNTAAAEVKYQEASRIQKALLVGKDSGADSTSLWQESKRAGSVEVLVGKPFLSPVDWVDRTVTFYQSNTIRFMHACPPMSKTYFELQMLEGVTCPQFGFVTSKFERCRVSLCRGVGNDAESWAVDGQRRLASHNGDKEYAVTWKKGDVIGLGCDLNKMQMLVAVNGDSSPPNGIVFQLDGEAARDGIYAAFKADSGVVKFNFGEDHPLAYVWEGFQPLGRTVRKRKRS